LPKKNGAHSGFSWDAFADFLGWCETVQVFAHTLTIPWRFYKNSLELSLIFLDSIREYYGFFKDILTFFIK